MRLRSHHVAEVFFFIRDEVVEKGCCIDNTIEIAHRLGMEGQITRMAIDYLIKENAIRDLTEETFQKYEEKDLTETDWIFRITRPTYILGRDISFLEKMGELDKYKDDDNFYEIPFVIDYIKNLKIFLFLFKKWKYKKPCEEWIHYTYVDIRKATNVSFSEVSDSLNEMVKLGILEIKKEKCKSNGYRFIEKNFNNYKRIE